MGRTASSDGAVRALELVLVSQLDHLLAVLLGPLHTSNSLRHESPKPLLS